MRKLFPSLALLAAAALLTGCADSEPQSRQRTYENFPGAPSSAEAPLAPGASTGQGPIAELADPTWLEETAQQTKIPQRVLAAYAGAALRTSETQPQCQLSWNTLAGIGSVETAHGQYLGSSVDDAGQVTPGIFGPALDGSEGVMEIKDTDHGELDDDQRWDRAVGPMQFIPTSWEGPKQDGNADGNYDPQQIDDAVLTAAEHLCQGESLTTDAGWNSAIAGYNRSVVYANKVAEKAEEYATSNGGF
ncbi:hypothetical protein [Rothia aerolata]|uniref:Transglycosylase SLT domain-containing protein n=1 Tax=Rothia aerolata TaxID=1812262 RepID=A0A917ITJ7_9MICC|nr:hypothetical protein [Rothia aerolata]GGH61409.1 hypothetical protein GCM10007359_10560 [Rothia aerolata]